VSRPALHSCRGRHRASHRHLHFHHLQPLQSSAFNAGVALERQRVVFALNLRKAIARRPRNCSEGSGDESACALLEAEEPEIGIESVLPPLPKELTAERRAFADAITAKINRTLRPEARSHL